MTLFPPSGSDKGGAQALVMCLCVQISCCSKAPCVCNCASLSCPGVQGRRSRSMTGLLPLGSAGQSANEPVQAGERLPRLDTRQKPVTWSSDYRKELRCGDLDKVNLGVLDCLNVCPPPPPPPFFPLAR